MPLLVHDQRVGDDVDDDDKRSRSEDLVRDPRVREIPVVVGCGGGWRTGLFRVGRVWGEVPCYSGRVGRDYFARPRGPGGGFLIALTL